MITAIIPETTMALIMDNDVRLLSLNVQTVLSWWENKPEVPNESVEFRAFLDVTKELYCNISF